MKIKTLSVFIALLVFASVSYGQKDYAFKVLVNKGKNEVKSGNSWEPVKVGASLKSGDELKLAENSYLGLVTLEGKPWELKDPGKYNVNDLAAKAAKAAKGTSVLNKYTDFILSSNIQKKNNLSATGAVHRGPLMVDVYLPPASSYVYGDTVTIVWEKNADISAPYIVVFNSLFGDELLKVETSDNFVTVNLSDKNFAAENDISVKVSSKKDNKESDPHTLRKFSKNDREKVNATFTNEIKTTATSKTALNMYYRALFFEQNKLLADAGTAFQEAIKLAPDVPYFREEYEYFVLRQGLKEPPKEK
jgi:hypothetical protein